MSAIFTPYDSYFDKEGRPTAAGQQLLAQINRILDTRTIPAGGNAGDVLTKATDGDYDVAWTAP